jgi:hypothetical protein
LSFVLILLAACEPEPLPDLEPPEVDLGSIEIVGAGAGLLETGRIYGHMAHLVGESIDDEPLSLGAVAVRNATTGRAEVTVSASVAGFSDVDTRTENVEAGSERTLTFAPKLDARAFQALDGDTPAQLDITLDVRGERVTSGFAEVTLVPTGTLPWEASGGDTRGLAMTLVTPDDPAVQQLVDAAEANVPDGQFGGYPQEPIAITDEMEAIHDALVAGGLVVDPLPDGLFDAPTTLALPGDLLAEPTGHALEAALLYASAYEAVGLQAGVVLTDDRVLVGARVVEDGDLVVLDLQADSSAFDDLAAAGVVAFQERLEREDFLFLDLERVRELGLRPVPR